MPLQMTELLVPIAAANPGGDDIRYDPVFEQIKQARLEEDDLPTGDWSRPRKTADYAQVIKLASEVLAKRSKDLQIGVWLVEAMLKREGIPGLQQGLEFLTALIAELWDHLHPAIEDGDLEYRAAPLEWLGKYLNPAIRLTAIDHAGHTIFQYRESRNVGYEADAQTSEQHAARLEALNAGKLSAEEFDQSFNETPKAWYKQKVAELDAALRAIDALNRTASDRFGASAPMLSPLRDAVEDVRQIAGQLLAQKLALDPDPVEVTSEAGAEGGDASGVASGSVTVSVTPRTRSDAEGRIAAAAKFLRAENAADPAPYLLLRGLRWGELRARAGEVDPRLLAAPPTELRARLRGLLIDARWAELLEAGEDVMATPYGRGWLDLQRYVLTACAGLGSHFDQVAASIQGALRGLLRDVPQLTTMVLMDDTPTANAETLAWLANQNLGGEVLPDAPLQRAPTMDGRGSGHGVFLRAMEKVRAGEPEKAIELLINQSFQERSARERFMRKSEAAKIMVDIGRQAIALPILEDLAREIDAHTLEDWEAGETVAQALGLLYRCIRVTQGDTAQTQGLYLRICRLDPIQAMEINGNAAS